MFGTSQSCRCPLCCEDDAAILRYDRKGKPYLRCRSCFSTMFIGDPRGLTMPLLLAPRIAALLKNAGLTVRDAQQEAEAIWRKGGKTETPTPAVVTAVGGGG